MSAGTSAQERHSSQVGGSGSRRFVWWWLASPRTSATDWEERYRALLGRSDVEVVGGSDEVDGRTNERIIERAHEIDERPTA
jgi:hypothetical protein